MSKVYSFRLDENNPREAQAKEVIEAWVAQGYSLRNQFVDMLILVRDKRCLNYEYGELIKIIERLIIDSQREKENTVNSRMILSEKFIGSLRISVKDGLKME